MPPEASTSSADNGVLPEPQVHEHSLHDSVVFIGTGSLSPRIAGEAREYEGVREPKADKRPHSHQHLLVPEP